MAELRAITFKILNALRMRRRSQGIPRPTRSERPISLTEDTVTITCHCDEHVTKVDKAGEHEIHFDAKIRHFDANTSLVYKTSRHTPLSQTT